MWQGCLSLNAVNTQESGKEEMFRMRKKEPGAVIIRVIAWNIDDCFPILQVSLVLPQ